MACKTKYQNTGKSRCQTDWMLFKKVLVLPYGTEFTGTDVDEWIMKGIHDANPSKRFYPMPDFTGIEDNSTEGSTYTSGYGVETPITKPLLGFTQTYSPDICLQNRLIQGFDDNMIRSFLMIDNSNRIWGVKTVNGLKGFTGKLTPRASGITTADSLTEPTIAYRFTVASEMENKWYLQGDLTAEELDGLTDINIEVTESGNNYLITFSTDGCGNEDVTAELATLSGKANVWLDGGTALTAANAPTYNNGVFTVAKSSITSSISLATPDILYNNNVTFKECVNSYIAMQNAQ